MAATIDTDEPIDRTKPPFWFLDLIMWWKRMQRRVDRRILIPALERAATDDFQLAVAFALHMAADSAWHVPGWQFTDWEVAFLDRLHRA